MKILMLILILMIAIRFPVFYLVFLALCVLTMLTSNAKKPDNEEIITLKLR